MKNLKLARKRWLNIGRIISSFIYWTKIIYTVLENGLYPGKHVTHKKLRAWDKKMNPYSKYLAHQLPLGNKIRRFHIASGDKYTIFFEIEGYLYLVNGFGKFCRENCL